jgi:subtilisin family serine protease
VPGDFKIGDDGRRRTTDQLEELRAANEGQLAWDTEAPADFTYLYHPEQVLVREEDVDAFVAFVEGNQEELFDGMGDRLDNPTESLARFNLPSRRGGQSVLEVLDRVDAALGPGRVTPNHYLHVTPVASCCPATEPEETGLTEPWPPECDEGRGEGVSVVVVDTGWHPPAADPNGPTPWLDGVTGDDENNGPDLREYAGHGTFIAGVVRCLARSATVFVEGFAVNGAGGGAILESDIVPQLIEALDHNPKVINLSAGCRTRGDHGPLTFETFYADHLKDLDCVLVAAAGNDSTSAPFWPAAFDWAVGVGSLDRDERVSSFSNHGVSADVYALGRNIVNAFPDGRYVCDETPNIGDVRVFGTGLARWSGTSFAAPIVAGLIAAEISASGNDAATARDTVLGRTVRRSDPEVGPIEVLRQPYCGKSDQSTIH